jgi:hypothetical protein
MILLSNSFRAKLIFALFMSISFYTNAQKEVESAKNQLLKSNQPYEVQLLSQRDIDEMSISSAYRSPSTNWFHVYFNQRYKKIEVYNALLNVVLQNNNVVHVSNQFVPKIEKFNVTDIPKIAPLDAISAACKHLGVNPDDVTFISSEALNNSTIEEAIFSANSISDEKIKTKLYWLPSENNQSIRLVWNVNIQIKATNDWWNVRIDAQTGEYIEKNNWTVNCNFDHPSSGQCEHQKLQLYQNQAPFLPIVANSYNVFDIPLEAPTFGSRSIVTNPYTRFVPTGTGPGATNGWHDNGTTSYTTTQGNNVLAQEDTDANNNTAGNMPNSPTLEFDFPYSFGPSTSGVNQNAAITNLFYWNNLIHDVLYKYGFDEPSGNFQTNNMSRGGNGNDHVLADAQDGGGTNNANFSTPIDGTNGRMQMYLWSNQGTVTNLTVNSPAGIAGVYTAVQSAFSTNNKLNGSITGDLVLVDDAGAAVTTSLGCLLPYDNLANIAGKIAVVDRGGTSCNFVTKVKNAQNAGAIAVIVVNNVSTTPIAMGGTDNTITIPAFMITQANGTSIKAQLTAGQTVNATLNNNGGYQPDGDFDNGIISHEYGHGWSNRLTGGPANSSCLSNAEQMGEGWSDFLGLMLTTDWSAQTPTTASANVPRGIGTYAIGQATTGGGIRPFPYSYNMASVNPTVTYSGVGNTATFSQPHGIGSIWCTMLWDMAWEIIFQDNQIVNDISNTSNWVGNAAAFKLVNEGLRLQKCSPSFVDGRDAILKADDMLFNGKYKCSIWKAFARRGLGVNASTGSSSNDRTVTQDFSLPGGVTIEKSVLPLAQNEGGNVTYTLKATCGCSAATVNITDNLPTTLTYVNGSANNNGSLSGNTLTWANQSFVAKEIKIYSFQATVGTGTFAQTSQAINDNFDGSTPTGSWVTGAITGTKNWTDNAAFFNSNATSKFAVNDVTISDFTLTSGVDYNILGPAVLSFWHKFDTEEDWDGGVVEITTNNGVSWTDLGAYFINNGYQGSIGAAGRIGFSGTSNWILSQINLEAFCGKTVRIRFRMFSDDNTVCPSGANCGWYIDDVILNIPSGINNTANSGTGSTDNACLQVTQTLFPSVQAKVFLQSVDSGTGIMDDYVKTLSNFPVSDPYSTTPLNSNFIHVNSGGTASTNAITLAVTGNDAIVDWVFLELRSGTSGNTTVVSTRAALLQKDGDIVDMDGVSPVKFTGATLGSYYISVRHRNHLGFRTSNLVSLSSTPVLLNFTNNSVTLHGATPVAVVGSVFAMNSGDSNFDGSIDAFDTILWETQNGLFDDYTSNADYNLDGSVDAFDTILWELNNGKFQELD